MYVLPPSMLFRAVMSVTLHTSAGDVKVAVAAEGRRDAARNFLALCASGAYDQSPFHRAVLGLCVQGGGRGKARKSKAAWTRRLPDEPAPDGSFAAAGVVAYANRGRCADDGVGSQFFITTAEAPHLDGTCTIIGNVLFGIDYVRRIEDMVLDDDVENPVILNVTVHANPFADHESAGMSAAV